MSHTPSPNFGFLADYDPRLVVTASRAERALSFGDSVGALVHIRTFGEFLAKGAVTELGGRLEERRLDSAILAKAFRGELVPQDPNDEPASVLLERLRNGREGAVSKRKATTQSTRAGKRGRRK